MAVKDAGLSFVNVIRRSGHVAVSSNNLIVVWGGLTNNLYDADIYVPTACISIYHCDLKYWSEHLTKGDIPPGTSGASGNLLQNKLYVFAGHIDSGNTNDLYCLDLNTLVWTRLTKEEDSQSQLPSPRDKFAFWNTDTKLYCFGGYGVSTADYLNQKGDFEPDTSSRWPGRGWNNQVFQYDTETGTWTNLRCKGIAPTPRAAHTAVLFDTDVYIFGGRHGDTRLNDLHCLDLKTLTWSGEIIIDGPSPRGRSWHTLTRLNEDVAFLYGGYSTDGFQFSDAWLLNVRCRQWSKLEVPCDRPRLWHTCCRSDDGEMFVFGGCTNNILDHTQPTNHSNEMLCFCLQPLKLQRLSLEAVFRHREQTRGDWSALPRTLQYWLDTRLKVVNLELQHKEVVADHKQGHTCSLS